MRVLLKLIIVLMLGVFTVGAHEDPAEKHKHKGHEEAGGNGQPGDQPLSALGAAPCAGGMAFTFPCRNVDLASFLPFSDIGGGTGNDIWGWTDSQTSREYALVGRSSGTSFVDITEPEHPVYLGNLPTHTSASAWRGIKVYANHAFIVSEAASHGMQVFDLTRLRGVTLPQTFTETAHYNGFGNSHTIAINEATGFAYAAGTNTCNSGLHIVDIRTPGTPAFAGCVSGDGYTHETQCVVYDGPDGRYFGRELCFSSNEDTLTIIDVTAKSAPVQLSRTGYTGSRYAHQGWLTEDHRYFLMDDELDEQSLRSNTRTIVWDVSNVLTPFVSGVHVGTTTAIDHNQYIRGEQAYQANYRSGLRILDISNVATPALSEVGYFDVYPVDDALGYNGAWSNYPFFRSDTVIVNGIEQGLFVLTPTVPSASEANLSVTVVDAPDPVSVGQNFTYTVGVSNSGLAGATGVALTVTLSPDVSLTSINTTQGSCTGTSVIACSLGTVPNGGSSTATVGVRAVRAGSVGMTAMVSANEGDPGFSNNTAGATTIVSAGTAAGNVHVGDLDSRALNVKKQTWAGTVTITAHNAAENALAGATVSGIWSGEHSGTATCTTTSAGRCDVSTGTISVRKTSATFTVTGVSHTSFAYDFAANHDVDGGTTGTAILVTKP